MDLDDESDSDHNDLDDLWDGYDDFPGNRSRSDGLTPLTGPSNLDTTPEGPPPEMMFDPSFDLGLEAIPTGMSASPMLTSGELDQPLSAVSATILDSPPFFRGCGPPSYSMLSSHTPLSPPLSIPSTTAINPALAFSISASGSSMPAPVDEWSLPDRKSTSSTTGGRTTLTLENAHPETLNSIMQIIIQSRTKVTMETH